MTTAVRQLLTTFESLPAPQQREAALEILKRAGVGTEGDIGEDVLVEAADELFREMDAEETLPPDQLALVEPSVRNWLGM